MNANDITSIHICFSSDEKYVHHMVVAMTSILKNIKSDRKPVFHILNGGISQKDKRKIEKLKKIKNFNIEYLPISSESFKNCPLGGAADYITLPAYYRFKITSLIKADKVIYLDCDLIVEDDISNLYDIDLKDNYIAAVPEPGNIFHRMRTDIKEHHYYCNSGVMLINALKWREDNIEQKLFDYCLNPTRKIIHHDQDVINEVLKYKILYLHQKWNCQRYAFEHCDFFPIDAHQSKEAINNPSIIHFTYRAKPWDIKCPDGFKKRYLHYLKQSPYKSDYLKLRTKKITRNLLRSIYSKEQANHHDIVKFLGVKFKFNNYKRMLDEALFKLTNIEKQNIKVISKMNAISNLHNKVFPKYKNVNEGRDVALIATGPSLANFKPIENAVYVGVNRAFKYDKVEFDYLFLQDYSGPTRSYIDDFVNYKSDKTRKFLGYLDYDIQKHCLIPETYSNYKNVERYYTMHPDLKDNFTLDLSSEPFGEAYSITFIALQFILWTNPKRVYLVGCDCSNSGHFDKNNNSLAVDYVMEGYKKLREFAYLYYPDTKIISINPVGLKGIFKDEYQNEAAKLN